MRREYYASLSSSPSGGDILGGGSNTNNDAAGAADTTTSSQGNTDITNTLPTYYDTETSAETATIAMYSITTIFLLTFVYLAVQLIVTQQPSSSVSPYLTTGSKIEFALLLLLIGLSCTAVSTSTNPIYGLAINPISGDVGYGNLYYSIWAGWACILTLVLSYIRTEYGIDVWIEMKVRGGKRLRLWVSLIVVNLLLMSSSATCYDARCGNYNEDDESDGNNNKIYYDNGRSTTGMDPWEESRLKKYCHRAAFGVSVGCIGCVTSLAVVAMRTACIPTGTTLASSSPQETLGGESGGDGESQSKRMIFVIECLSSWVLFLMNCFSVAYLTSEGGPGATLGNLFYTIWITFGLVIFAAVSCFGEVQMAKKIYQRRYMRQSSSADNSMSDGGLGMGIGMESISNLSSTIYERHSSGGFSSSRFDDYESEDAPSMIIRSCAGSVAEVQVGD